MEYHLTKVTFGLHVLDIKTLSEEKSMSSNVSDIVIIADRTFSGNFPDNILSVTWYVFKINFVHTAVLVLRQ